MMPHVCNQIKKAVVVLVTGLTTTTTNVFESRARPVDQSSLPCLLVYTTNEAISLVSGTMDAPMRLLSLRIQGVVEATSSLDDTLDTILKEVEVALGADYTVGGLAIGLDLAGWTKEYSAPEGEKPIGSINIEYVIQYRTPFGSPETVA